MIIVTNAGHSETHVQSKQQKEKGQQTTMKVSGKNRCQVYEKRKGQPLGK